MERKTQQTSAAMAGMSIRSAQKWQCDPLPSETGQERWWRTRTDPFGGVWEEEILPLSHRIAFYRKNQHLPTGRCQLVMHTCRDRRRCNPKHLEHADAYDHSQDTAIWFWDGRAMRNKANHLAAKLNPLGKGRFTGHQPVRDANCDGVPDNVDPDANGDGVADAARTNLPDTDTDGVPDAAQIDLADSNGDGVPNAA